MTSGTTAHNRGKTRQAGMKGAYEMVRAVGPEVGRSRFVLDWRTRMGHRVAVRKLELLRVAVGPKGWRCVSLYDRPEFRFPVPLLWVYVSGAANDVGAVVRVKALPGENWGYFQAGDGRESFIWPCGDVKAAADALDLLLQHRLIFGGGGGGLRRATPGGPLTFEGPRDFRTAS